jgi:ABC-type transporter Mla subunit MlaD
MSTLRRMFAVLTSSRALMLGALAAAGLAGGAFLGGSPSHSVVAYFADADGLVAGNEIRVAGLQSGGTVDTVQVKVDPATGKQSAVATLNIDDQHWPLHKGTRFAVRPKGVLSNVYVAMSPGPASAPALDGAHVFSLAETESPINLDAFSNLFDANVRESIRTQIQEGVLAFGGTGAENTNGLLQNLNPLTRDLSPITAVLAQRSPELDRLNAEFDTITADLAREDNNLGGLIENGNTFLHAIATHAQALQGTLVHAAGTLTSIDSALKGEESNLAAIFRKGPESLDASKALADQTNPVLAYINPHIRDLDTLLNYFLSATGYEAPGSNVMSSRIDATVYAGNQRSAIACGGQQWKDGPNNNAGCSSRSLPPPDAGAQSASSSNGFTLPAAPGAATENAPATPSVHELYGVLFQ